MRFILSFIVVSSCVLGAEPSQTWSWAPPQLHPRRFAACLHEKAPKADLKQAKELGKTYSLNSLDLLLVHLAVYPGVQIPGLGTFQAKARTWWGEWWEDVEADLVTRIENYGKNKKTLVPAALFEEALTACGAEDFFCASLVSHNVLRTLGRWKKGVHHGFFGQTTDYNPAWFQSETKRWKEGIPRVQKAMVSLRADGTGDRWGEWYHFFGILTYAIHEAALGKSPKSTRFVVEMNELLNPFLAGGTEEPEKARLDRDSVEVAQWFLTDTNRPLGLDCTKGDTYTAGTWSESPEPFPMED